MTRILKYLAITAAVAALAVLGVVGISGADTTEFHCSTSPCRITAKPDGTGTTAHQVISLWGGGSSFQTTCSTVTGEATVNAKAFGEFTVTNIVGSGCSVLGIAAELKMNGCNYVLTAGGSFSVVCPAGKEIEAGTTKGCLYFIPSQGPFTGVSYHNIGAGTQEVTVQMQIKGMKAKTNGACGTGTGFVEAEYIGNTILTGETDPGGEKVSLFWE